MAINCDMAHAIQELYSCAFLYERKCEEQWTQEVRKL